MFTQPFTIGNIKRKTNLSPAIETAFKLLPENYPSPSRYFYDGNLIKSGANTFKTSFFNNSKLNFISRQKQAIGTSLKTRDKTLIYAIQCLINGWEYEGRTYSDIELQEVNNQHLESIEKNKTPSTQPTK